MTALEYFKFALQHKLLHKLRWYAVVFTIYAEENEYLVMKDSKMYVKHEGSLLEITDYVPNKPLLQHTTKIKLTNEDMPNIEKEVDTTIGRALINYLMLAEPFGGLIPYINEPNIQAKMLEQKVMKLLGLDQITVKQYLRFVDNSVFISNLSKFLVINLTEKNMLPPPDLDKFKKDLEQKYIKEYGDKWYDDQVISGKFIKDLENHDKEYLKDDPTYGISLVGKAMESRRKTMLTFAAAPSKLDPHPKFMIGSLKDGYPLDENIMTGVINGIIDGSLARGKETQVGGVIYKVLTKVGRDIAIVPGDCGTKLYREVLVDEDNAKILSGVNMVEGSNLVELTDATEYIGKVIKIRSPLFCIAGPKKYCECCVGRFLKDKKDGVAILFTYISEVFLTASLKKMHTSSITLTKYSLIENLK